LLLNIFLPLLGLDVVLLSAIICASIEFNKFLFAAHTVVYVGVHSNLVPHRNILSEKAELVDF